MSNRYISSSIPLNMHWNGRFIQKECDLLLVLGTSLQVAPVSSIPKKVSSKVPAVLINREKVGYPNEFDGVWSIYKYALYTNSEWETFVYNMDQSIYWGIAMTSAALWWICWNGSGWDQSGKVQITKRRQSSRVWMVPTVEMRLSPLRRSRVR